MVSVVIPAYNEEKVLATCLESLIKQNTTKNFEVILVDNNSTDATRSIAETYKSKLHLRILNEKTKGRGSARSAGFAAAKGSLILSTDADTIVPENWIFLLTKEFADTNIAAVTGTCRINDCSPLTNFLFNNIFQISTEIFYRLVHGHWCLIGPNFAIRKEVYLKSGGFNQKLNCREDADLSGKVSKIGKIKRVPVSVLFSGRRYKKGLLIGALPYILNQVKELFTGRTKIVLKDMR